MGQAVLTAAVHDYGADEEGEENGGDHCLLLAGQGEGPREGGQPAGERGAFLPLAHLQGAF